MKPIYTSKETKNVLHFGNQITPYLSTQKPATSFKLVFLPPTLDDDGEEKKEKEEEEEEDNNHDDDPTGLQILIANPSLFHDICLSTMPFKNYVAGPRFHSIS